MPAHFVVITDSHYHPCAPHDYGAPKMLTRSRDVLDATVPAVNAVGAGFVVHGGDLLCGGDSFDLPRPEYDRALHDVAAAYAGFEAPVHYVPGNHDCDAQDYRFDAFADTFPIPDVLDTTEVAPGLRLATANVYHQGTGGSGGWTDALDESLRAADARARADGAVVLLVLHPWVLPGAGEAGLVDDARRLRATLAACPSVAATFSGHRHANRVRLHGDWVAIDTACLIGYPMGFRELTLDDDGWLTCRWHTLDLPDLLEESRARSSAAANDRWAGDVVDRETAVLLPRAREMWRVA